MSVHSVVWGVARWPWWAVGGAIQSVIKRAIYWLSEQTVYHGVVLVSNNESNADFFKLSRDALDLISAVDSRRFQRVQKNIKIIENTIFPHRAHYYHRLHACGIDYGFFSKNEDSAYAVRDLACTLVHEATHGHLRSKGFRPSHKRYQQVERMCVREELYFVRRFSDCSYDWENEKRAKLLRASSVCTPRLQPSEFYQWLTDIWKG
jgi:hypothetical protein